MPKTAEDIAASREERERLRQKWGGTIPTSIWEINYGLDGGIIEFDQAQNTVADKKHAAKILHGDYDPTLRSICAVSAKVVRGKGAGLSVFPYDLLRRAVLFYTEPGELVLDPCAGHNSRMQGVWELGRGYVGYDICKEFMTFNRDVSVRIQKADQGAFFSRGGPCLVLHEQSSEHMEEADNSVHFVFTSPPYWNLEFYGDHPAQLGWNHTYPEFLDGIQRVAAESFRVLKPGRYAAININDFQADGKFYMYHADLAERFVRVGFALHDLIIVKWAASFGTIFASQVESRKKVGKMHEFLVVLKKPA